MLKRPFMVSAAEASCQLLLRKRPCTGKQALARYTACEDHEPDNDTGACEEVRSLTDKIIVTPMPAGRKRMRPQLRWHDALAASWH